MQVKAQTAFLSIFVVYPQLINLTQGLTRETMLMYTRTQGGQLGGVT
jgi:hypothetical protein